ncbi:unnamed protein product [Ectocarpus sp. 12 AP-2014]
MAGGIKQAFAHATELVTVRHHREESRPAAAAAAAASGGGGDSDAGACGGKDVSVEVRRLETREEDNVHGGVAVEKLTAETERQGGDEEASGEAAEPPLLPGKELVKRMKNISQYIVARSKTAEEAYSDTWEVVMEMADRAASRGCDVPTEDYTSSSAPCYGALLVTPDIATYSSDTFLRFQASTPFSLSSLKEGGFAFPTFLRLLQIRTPPPDPQSSESPRPHAATIFAVLPGMIREAKITKTHGSTNTSYMHTTRSSWRAYLHTAHAGEPTQSKCRCSDRALCNRLFHLHPEATPQPTASSFSAQPCLHSVPKSRL